MSFFGSAERQRLSQPTFELLYQCISYLDVVPPITNELKVSNIYKIQIPFDGPTKGFFIQCENVNLINGITLKLNDFIRYDYGKFLIKSKTKKFTDTLLYIPSNIDAPWSKISKCAFNGHINLSRVAKVEITIKLDLPIGNLRLYGLGANLYRQDEYIGQIVFSNFKLHCERIYLNCDCD